MRSARTVSQHFHHVLIAVLRLHSLLLAKPVPISADSSCWKWGVWELDGTYIDVRVSAEDRARYRTRKGSVSVNVLGVCDSEMRFIYVLVGWEGSAADRRVLRDAVSRPNGLKIPRGNSYLVDSGYSKGEGFLSPYRGVRYHLKEYDTGRNSPQNHEEFFNMKHASARNVIERTFGLLKARWAILRSPAFYSIKIQNRIIMACCLLHNYIRQEMADDPIEQLLTDEGSEDEDFGEYLGTVDSNPIWNIWRDEMAKSISWILMGVLEGIVEGPKLIVRVRSVFGQLKKRRLCWWKCDNGFRTGYLVCWIFVSRSWTLMGVLEGVVEGPKLMRTYACITDMLARSGFGWNESIQTIVVSDEVFDSYAKIDHFTKTLRFKLFPYYPSWSEIFGKDRATGEHAEDIYNASNNVSIETVPVSPKYYVPSPDPNVLDDDHEFMNSFTQSIAHLNAAPSDTEWLPITVSVILLNGLVPSKMNHMLGVRFGVLLNLCPI
ncbi:UNVERIFIED_CONTAM: hypothetical protein Slati_0537900 [Sesamum latifolium]|uniref:DDE Tnp4 domain-containing protein n=1 Tax=Sesamum latifolium TaxID=2727402 RepID=A0AAW2Y0A1_9LAMI